MFAILKLAKLTFAKASDPRGQVRISRFIATTLARHFLLAAACSAVAALALGSPAKSAAAEPTYAIVMAKTKTIKAFDHFDIHTPELKAKTWILVAAQAPELPYQTGTTTRLLPGGETCADLSPRNRALLRSRVAVKEPSLEHVIRGRVEFQTTLHSRTLVRRVPGARYPPAEKISRAERQSALAETPTIDFSAEVFQHWLQANGLRKNPNETDFDFGRRVFLAIARGYQYQYVDGMDRHASHTCQQDKADCGGLCALFAATLRASKVPARLRVGHWARSEDPNPPPQGRVAHRAHVKAEFYVDGVGWIPVDLSAAVEFDKTPLGLRFFGNDQGDFLTVHLDYDLDFDTELFGVKPLRHLQSARYFVRGEGKLDGATIDRNWQVETLR